MRSWPAPGGQHRVVARDRHCGLFRPGFWPRGLWTGLDGAPAPRTRSRAPGRTSGTRPGRGTASRATTARTASVVVETRRRPGARRPLSRRLAGRRWPAMRARDVRSRLRRRVDRCLGASAEAARLVAAALVTCGRRLSRPEVVIDLRVVVTRDLTEPVASSGHSPTSECASSDHRDSAHVAGQWHRHATGRPHDASRPPRRHLRLVPPPGTCPDEAGSPKARSGRPGRGVADLRRRRSPRWSR
jgi:hypothetical protein